MNTSGNHTGGPSSGPDTRSENQGADFIIGLFALVAGLLVVAVLVPWKIGTIGSDPTILAMIGAGGLALFGALLSLEALRNRTSDRHPATARPASNEPGPAQALGFMVTAIFYAATVGWLGFAVSSYITLAVLLLILRVRSPLIVLLLPAAVVLAIYLGLEFALGARLPEGRISWPLISQVISVETPHV